MNVKAIPEGYHRVTVYLAVSNAAEAIEFYQEAFGAEEEFRLELPAGQIGHAELRIGDTRLMMSSTCDQSPLSPPGLEARPAIGLHLYVEDVDKSFDQALEAGAIQLSAVSDQFYGDRMGTLKDPFGHVWFIATHKLDLTSEQISERAQEMCKFES